MGYDILHRVGIDATVDKVTFFKNHDMKVVQAVPGELVKWRVVRGCEEWMDTEISFQLVRRQDQTFVLFKHAGWKEPVEFMHHCSTKWAIFLTCSLKALLETGRGRPAPDDVKVYVGG